MISTLGNILQTIAILSCFAGIAFGRKKWLFLSCLSVIGAFFLLVIAFVRSDFSIQNVFLNSGTLVPMLYKVAGSWASHEGSMLLWLCLFSMVSMVAAQLEESLVRLLLFVQLLFLSFLYLTSSPFVELSFKPEEGMGLNPLLQDRALAVHPPLLYLGYVSSAVPFAASCMILIRGEVQGIMLRIMRLFTAFSLLFMTAGIALGSWWAYRELGWGGYWFFDPVENVSLMPWLSAVALHHTLLITAKEKRLLSWALTLAILTFLLVTLGTFLVRSGILTSVHSFAFSPQRGIYMLAIFALISIPSIALLSTRDLSLPQDTIPFKEIGLIAGNITWLVSLLILVTATLSPVAYSVFYQESITVDLGFYTKIFVPILILALFLAGIFSYKSFTKDHITNILLALVITLVTSYKLKLTLVLASGLAASIFLVGQTMGIFWRKTKGFRLPLHPSASAMIIGHLGAGLLLFSIVLNSALQDEIEFIGTAGEKVEHDIAGITLKNVYFSEMPNYYRQVAEFWVADKRNLTILKPENRLYKLENALSQESDIYSYLTADWYAVLSKIEGEVIHAKIYYRPMISFLWISAFLICSGFLISLLRQPGIPGKKSS